MIGGLCSARGSLAAGVRLRAGGGRRLGYGDRRRRGRRVVLGVVGLHARARPAACPQRRRRRRNPRSRCRPARSAVRRSPHLPHARSHLAACGTAVTGGTLRIPVGPAQDGSVAPDTATLQACASPAPSGTVEGSTAAPPQIDCRAATSAAKHAAAAGARPGDVHRRLVPFAAPGLWGDRRRASSCCPPQTPQPAARGTCRCRRTTVRSRRHAHQRASGHCTGRPRATSGHRRRRRTAAGEADSGPRRSRRPRSRRPDQPVPPRCGPAVPQVVLQAPPVAPRAVPAAGRGDHRSAPLPRGVPAADPAGVVCG